MLDPFLWVQDLLGDDTELWGRRLEMWLYHQRCFLRLPHYILRHLVANNLPESDRTFHRYGMFAYHLNLNHDQRLYLYLRYVDSGCDIYFLHCRCRVGPHLVLRKNWMLGQSLTLSRFPSCTKCDIWTHPA